jgi:hypothetical protein
METGTKPKSMSLAQLRQPHITSLESFSGRALRHHQYPRRIDSRQLPKDCQYLVEVARLVNHKLQLVVRMVYKCLNNIKLQTEAIVPLREAAPLAVQGR